MIPDKVMPGKAHQPNPVILIVEDDVLIRAAAAQYLRGSGYDVLEAVDVDEAIGILAAALSVRLVFIDVQLPGTKSGMDLLDIIERDFPDVKMLFTSGVVRGDELARRGIDFLRKPYFLFEMGRRIETLIAPEGTQD